MRHLLPLLALLASCAPVVPGTSGGGDDDPAPDVGGDGADGADGADGEDGADGADGSDGSDGADGTDGTDGTEFTYDCDALPDFNQGDDVIEHARGYHGLAMMDDGSLLGWDMRDALVAATYDGDQSVWLPGLNSVEQIARHPDGHLFYASSAEGAVYRVESTGARTMVGSGFYDTYGVTLAPDGNLIIADGNVWRLDPTTGEKTVLAEAPSDYRWWAHATGLSLDSTVLYISTVGNGQLLQLALDADLNPIGEPELLVSLPGGWQDAVGVDACGNLYIPDYYRSTLFRVKPDGTYREIVNRSEWGYGHGVVWGRGIGGWREDAIYMPQPYNDAKVREVVIGVPDGATVRTWNGVAVGL